MAKLSPRLSLGRWLPRHKVLRWSVLGLGGIVGLLVLLFVLVQTPPGKSVVARIASSMASGDGLQVEIGDVTGLVPWNLRVGKLTLRDPHGVFAQAEDLRIDWHPWQLLHGVVAIDDLQAAQIDFQRKPDLPPSPKQPGDSSGGLPHILVDRISLPRIELGDAVLGSKAELSLTAAVDSAAELTSFTFAAERHDAPGAIKGTAKFAPGGKTLDVDVSADEPAGGLVARLLNIDGAPALHAALKGHGSLEQWDGTLQVTAGPEVQVDGTATIRAAVNQPGGGHRATLELTGALAKLLPADIAPLFEGDTKISGAALVDDKALVSIESFSADSAGATVKLGGSFDAQAFLAHLTFEVQTKDAKRYAALLPPGAGFGGLVAKGTIEGAPEAPSIVATVVASDAVMSGYRVATLTADLKTAPDANKGLTLALDGQAEGLSADDAAVGAALGGTAHVSASGSYSAKREIDITSVTLDGPSGEARFAGHATPQAIAGKLQVARFDLAVAAPFAGHKLGGQLVLDATIKSSADFNAFALELDGHVDNFHSDIATLNGLMVPSLKLSGRLTRAADGSFAASAVKASSTSFDATLDGRLDQSVADLKAQASFADLSKLDARLSGNGTVDARFAGTLDKLDVQGSLQIAKGKAMGRDIDGLTLKVDAKDVTGAATGTASLDGTVGGKPATGNATITTAADGSRHLDDFALNIGSVTGKGALTQTPDGKIAGTIALKAGNLDDLAPLTLTEMAGQLDATIKFDTDKDTQRITIDGTAGGVRAADIALGSARIKLTLLDPSGAPQINGTAELANLRSGSLVIDKATLTASNAGDATDLKVNATSLGASIDGSGKLITKDGASVLNLAALKIVKDGATATLAGPATITFDHGTTRIDRLVLNANGGSVAVQGTAGDALNLKVDLRSLPLSLLAVAAPDMNASGAVSGTISLTGPATAPNGQYELTVAKATTPALARGGLGPFDVKAHGAVGGGKVTVEALISAPSLKGITVAGSVPLNKGELDLTVKGQAGLNLVNTALATTSAYASGALDIDASIKGTTDAPLASGTIRIADGRFTDALSGMSFQKINAEIVAEGRQVTIRSFTAQTAGDGKLQAQGNITLDPQAGFPGTIQLTAQKARLLSNETVRLVADAKLSLEGAMATNPKLSGRIDVRNLDVNIPDKLPGSIAATEVRHVNLPAGQKAEIQTPQTKAKDKRDAENGKKSGKAVAPLVMDLDLTVAAPARVFVRGRGIEAEFGGTLKITGTSANPVTNGGFNLKHGRFTMGDQRLDFSRGKILFAGTTDPTLDFAADSKSADITATVNVTGQASAPQIGFSSTPSLPEDEILARLLFGKPAGALTPGQAIQVARAIQQFSGGGGHRLDDVRRSLGINSLDIGTGENGSGGQVGIGKRLNDNVYLGVSQGTTSDSGQVSVDVDVLKNIKVTGKAGATGGEVGIGAEWDY